jgi:hypothetical protein
MGPIETIACGICASHSSCKINCSHRSASATTGSDRHELLEKHRNLCGLSQARRSRSRRSSPSHIKARMCSCRLSDAKLTRTSQTAADSRGPSGRRRLAANAGVDRFSKENQAGSSTSRDHVRTDARSMSESRMPLLEQPRSDSRPVRGSRTIDGTNIALADRTFALLARYTSEA